MTSVGVAFITHSAKAHLQRSLPPVLACPVRPRVLVVNSSSEDGTVEEARRLGAETHVIPRHEFNHGTTRELARCLLGTEIVVMMTPDAYAIGSDMIGRLIRPILQGEASLAYARQIPHDGAGFLESFGRQFLYPSQSHVRSVADVATYGSYIFFNSDSCAAYSNAALDDIGGFRAVLSNEDALAAAMLLRRGHKIAYAADSVVQHSHTYTLRQEFRRLFDAGLSQRGFSSEFAFGSSHNALGRRFARELLKIVAAKRPWLLPTTIVRLGVKYLGFKFGAASIHSPLWWKRFASSQDYYWNSCVPSAPVTH